MPHFFFDISLFVVPQVKSFIETQRALLAEIQNGCKRNFILAKEKEETEQMMRQSASMAEIATEDGTREEEEEQPAAEGRGDAKGKEGEGKVEATGDEVQTVSQSGEGTETSIPQMILDSDSDTDDEDGEEVVTKSSSTSNSSTRFSQTSAQTQTTQPPPAVPQPHPAPHLPHPPLGPVLYQASPSQRQQFPPGPLPLLGAVYQSLVQGGGTRSSW